MQVIGQVQLWCGVAITFLAAEENREIFKDSDKSGFQNSLLAIFCQAPVINFNFNRKPTRVINFPLSQTGSDLDKHLVSDAEYLTRDL
jgi:hypothetical protein